VNSGQDASLSYPAAFNTNALPVAAGAGPLVSLAFRSGKGLTSRFSFKPSTY